MRFGQDLRAAALPPLRPAAFFCAVVPPCDELLRDEDECEFLPPRLDAPDEFAIRAARSFDIPLSFSASYCFSFFTFARFPGIGHLQYAFWVLNAGIGRTVTHLPVREHHAFGGRQEHGGGRHGDERSGE